MLFTWNRHVSEAVFPSAEPSSACKVHLVRLTKHLALRSGLWLSKDPVDVQSITHTITWHWIRHPSVQVCSWTTTQLAYRSECKISGTGHQIITVKNVSWGKKCEATMSGNMLYINFIHYSTLQAGHAASQLIICGVVFKYTTTVIQCGCPTCTVQPNRETLCPFSCQPLQNLHHHNHATRHNRNIVHHASITWCG